MNQRTKGCALATACLCGASAAHAQLWDTGPWDGIDGRSSDRATPPSRPQTRAADDAVLPTGNGMAYAITGLSGRVLAKNYTGFFAEVYPDNAGIPAAMPSATLAATGSQVLQTGVFGELDLLNVTLDTAGLTLAPGRWWISLVCDVSGQAPPADGYGFFCTGGSMVVQGRQGYYMVGGGPWLPSSMSFGTPSDFSFTLLGAQMQPACYPNCDHSTAQPILNVNDFSCFLNKFAAGDSYANCDGSTLSPVLNINDFGCFLNRFSAGCS